MRNTHRLTAQQVKSLTKAGYHPDGGGLLLQVSKAGTKSWLYRYGVHGRYREMGLGGYPTISLSEARSKAAEARRLKANGIDPLGEKHNARRVARNEQDLRMSFEDAATHYIDLKRGGWSEANATSWQRSIDMYVNPVIGRMDLGEIHTTHILRVLEPIWTARRATATALRQRIERVLDWAKSSGRREGDNPARLAGHLENLLPAVDQATEHRPALPWREMPAFMVKLRVESGNLARLMEWLVLTGTRAGEGSGATWGEIDLDAKLWRIPKERMKAKKEHWVPLSGAALELLEALPGERRPTDLVFPSSTGKPIWDADLAGLLRRLGYPLGTVTTHGMRSSLRTFLTENAKAEPDVAESVLAHDKRGAVQKSYERTRHLDARRPLMETWAIFLDTPVEEAKVLTLQPPSRHVAR
ncbi:phage integrase [Caballeronia terrestris]|uniref:Phage integrase n=1 Tax=Caballeronia terrestris TaxID=1226301 RepID=A0A158FYS5_9BURK|nr:integrase arm-type DNA-binding domain-containing protein [Caballeronia terrestris]SAL24994.1 phage integrase [Caballeronia terrestris]